MCLTASLEPSDITEKIESILLETDWDAKVAELKPTRDQLYPLLKVQPLVVATTSASNSSL